MKRYLVGGAVRDALLNLPVVDRDWVIVGADVDALLAAGYQPVGAEEGKELYLKLQPDGYQMLVNDKGTIRSLLSHRENCASLPYGHICSGL